MANAKNSTTPKEAVTDLPQTATGAKKILPADIENCGLDSTGVIRMNEGRSDRFIGILDDTSVAVASLQAAVPLFPLDSANEGEMHPATTVEVFTGQLLRQLSLLRAMVNFEDARDA